MPSSPISTLPPEVLHQVLTYLPIATLFKFARTSRRNYDASILALQNLQLAVFPREIHGLLAYLASSSSEDLDAGFGELSDENPTRNQITIPAPLTASLLGDKRSKHPVLSPAQYREQLFRLQNALACSILSTPTLANLHSLTLHIYHITSSSLTQILATHFPNLQHLRLNFSHPYIHDSCLPAKYWTSPVFLRGSPIWNALAGIGDDSAACLRLRKLETLTLERAGITSVQLRRWIEHNPRLSRLTLRNVSGVDPEFVQWLGEYYDGEKTGDERPAVKLKTLALEHCSSLSIKSIEELGWLDSLFESRQMEPSDGESSPGLEVLSFNGSQDVSRIFLLAYLETMRPPVQQITLPEGKVLVAKLRSRAGSESSTGSRDEGADSVRQHMLNHRLVMGQNQSTQIVIDPQNGTGSDPNIATLSLSLNDGSEDDEDEDEDDESPVSYLRSASHRRTRKMRSYRPGQGGWIEPDTQAR